MNTAKETGDSDSKSAFTLRDLLAVICTVFLLTFLATPALHKTNDASKAHLCMNNQKQLISAWQMYADENDGRLVENYHGGQIAAAANDPRNAPWACGWLDWGTSPDNTNMLYLRSTKYARFSPYLKTDGNVHKCPADVYLGRAQRERGWKERVRSYSMNMTIGSGNAITGAWHPIYKQAKRMDEVALPSPGKTTVLLDEHPGSINDPALFPPGPTSWTDYPSAFHKKAGTIAFADSHVEVHEWIGPLRQTSVDRSDLSISVPPTPADPDRAWLSYHSQRRGPESY